MWPLRHSIDPVENNPCTSHTTSHFLDIRSFRSNLSSSDSSIFMSLRLPARLLLLGAPGSGKGTQSARLLNVFPQIKAISSGDILRNEMLKKSRLGLEASSFMAKGELVPDSTMVALIADRMKNNPDLDSAESWLLDGFPRTRGQAEALDTVLNSELNINLVVELDVDQDVILQRIEARWVHAPSGRVYNLDYNPPKVPFKDDETGEALIKRPDDTAAVFQRRLDTYNKELAPLREFYQEKGIFACLSGNTSDIIFPKLQNVIRERFS